VIGVESNGEADEVHDDEGEGSRTEVRHGEERQRRGHRALRSQPEVELERSARNMPKSANPKTAVKVKDLAPKGGASKDVKGGIVGPCDRSRK